MKAGLAALVVVAGCTHARTSARVEPGFSVQASALAMHMVFDDVDNGVQAKLLPANEAELELDLGWGWWRGEQRFAATLKLPVHFFRELHQSNGPPDTAYYTLFSPLGGNLELFAGRDLGRVAYGAGLELGALPALFGVASLRVGDTADLSFTLRYRFVHEGGYRDDSHVVNPQLSFGARDIGVLLGYAFSFASPVERGSCSGLNDDRRCPLIPHLLYAGVWFGF